MKRERTVSASDISTTKVEDKRPKIGVDEEKKTRENSRKQKKGRKLAANVEANPPKFFYAPAELSKRKEPLGIEDIRDAVLHMVAKGAPPSWLRIQNTSHISKVVVLLVPGITPSLLHLKPPANKPNSPIEVPKKVDDIPFMAKFHHACPTKAPGDSNRMHSVMSAFVNTPVTGEEKKRRLEERIVQERLNPSSPLNYILTLEQMIDNDYPIPSYMATSSTSKIIEDEGWVETPIISAAASRDLITIPKVYALDCEMCVTESGEKALTHICVISYDTNEKLIDMLIKPHEPIVDYLTRFSGVTAEALANVTARIEDAQKALKDLLSSSSPPAVPPILLGHSLDSDLKALKYRHSRCIDTSVIFDHPRGAPYKPGLAWLTKKWCKREIQKRGEGGHDPEEDAKACIDLLKRKLAYGPGYGEFKVDQESIFDRMARANAPSPGSKQPPHTRPLSAVVDHGKPSSWYGKRADTSIGCKTDEEVVAGIRSLLQPDADEDEEGAGGLEGEGEGEADGEGEVEGGAEGEVDGSSAAAAAPSTPTRAKATNSKAKTKPRVEGDYKFVFARLTNLANGVGWISASRMADAKDNMSSENPSPPPQPHPSSASSASSTSALLKNLNTNLQAIYDSLPTHAALIIFTGHSDPRAMAELNQRRVKFEGLIQAAKEGANGADFDGSAVRDENGEEVKWTTQDARALEAETAKAKKGLMFMCIKKD